MDELMEDEDFRKDQVVRKTMAFENKVFIHELFKCT